MDWQAGARSEWQAISASASFKWSLYAFVALCRRCCRCLFFMRPLSFAVHFRRFFLFFFRLKTKQPSQQHWPFKIQCAAYLMRCCADKTATLSYFISWPRWPPVSFFLPFSFWTLVCTECPIRWKQVLLSLEQQVWMWHICYWLCLYVFLVISG